MAHKTQTAPTRAFALIAGQRVTSDLVNDTQTHALRFTAQAQVDITVAGAAVRNRGSVWAIFDEIGLSENGTDKAVLNGRIARMIAEAHAPSALSATRLAGAGVQAATIIKEELTVHFASPLAASPSEAIYREKVVKNAVQAFAKLSSATLINLLASGATGTVTNISLKVQHVHDPRTKGKPFFIPTYRQLTLAIPSAQTDWTLDLKTTKFLRFFALQQDSDAGEVGDIITDLELRGDYRHIIGPGRITWDELTRSMEAELGGSVYSSGTGLGQNAYYMKNFQSGGRLSNIVNPRDDVNLRFLFNAAPSAQAGATNSKIVCAICELENDPELTQMPGEPGFPPV